jgi:hypothetical protein
MLLAIMLRAIMVPPVRLTPPMELLPVELILPFIILTPSIYTDFSVITQLTLDPTAAIMEPKDDTATLFQSRLASSSLKDQVAPPSKDTKI